MTEPRTAAPRWIAAVRMRPWLGTLATLVRRFREDRLALAAGSLTFTTVISLVPLVAVTLALFSIFPMFATLQGALQQYFLQTLVPDAIARPVMSAITQFANRANRLGSVGLVALVVSALAMMLTIDRALNAIWRVRRPRRLTQRVIVYFGAVTLGPFLFAVSLGATSYALTASHGVFGAMPRGFGVVIASVEFVLEALGVAALYHYVPNTFVRWRHALIGGLFVAICIAGCKRAMTFYFGVVQTYSMVYGAFATLPIFLVWIYVCWVIVLLGAVIAAYAPLVGKQIKRRPETPGWEFRLALVVLGKLDETRHGARQGFELNQIADAIGVDPLQMEPVLDALVELGWVGRIEDPRGARYVQRCDPATTPAEPLVAKLLLDPAPDLEATWMRAGFGQMRLGDLLQEAAAKPAAPRSGRAKA